MSKRPINEFPLIAITEVLDMYSVDRSCVDGAHTVEDVLDFKYNEVKNHAPYTSWGTDWKEVDPVYVSFADPVDEWDDTEDTLRNGHHRVAQAHALGLLFIHYTDDQHEGWRYSVDY